MIGRYQEIRDALAMLSNDHSRCQGAVTEYIDADTRTTTIAMHPQCIDCARRTDVLPDQEYPWMDAPLGLLAEPNKLCETRRT